MLSVGQACNFKCRDCGNFAPYSPRELLRYPIETVVHELDMLFSCSVMIDKLQIQGGEPFCYSDMPKLLEYLGGKKRAGMIGDIDIATNGSIMPPEEVLGSIKKYDIRIRISDYNVAPDKVRKLEQKCRDYCIRYMIYDFCSTEGQWYNEGGVETPRENDDKLVKRRYKLCQFRGCLTLEHGELTYCSRATNSYRIQGFERNEMDYLVLSGTAEFKETLKKFLFRRHYMEACRYCNGTNDKLMIPPAIQITDH